MGVRTGMIPVSQGTMMPMQPSHSKMPSMRMGIRDAPGFMWPSAICSCLLLLSLPKPGIMNAAASKPCIIQSIVFIFSGMLQAHRLHHCLYKGLPAVFIFFMQDMFVQIRDAVWLEEF